MPGSHQRILALVRGCAAGPFFSQDFVHRRPALLQGLPRFVPWCFTPVNAVATQSAQVSTDRTPWGNPRGAAP